MDHALADTKFQVSTSEYLDGKELGSSEYLGGLSLALPST